MKKRNGDTKKASQAKIKTPSGLDKIDLLPKKKKRTIAKRRKLSDIFASLDRQANINDERDVLPPKRDGKEPKRRQGRRRPNKSARKQSIIKGGATTLLPSTDQQPPSPTGGDQGQLPPTVPSDPSEFRLQGCAESLYGKEFFLKKETSVVGLHTAMMVIAQNPHCHEAVKALINATHSPSVSSDPKTTMITAATHNHWFLSTPPAAFNVSGHEADQLELSLASGGQNPTPNPYLVYPNLLAPAGAMLPHQHQVPAPPEMMMLGFPNFPGRY